MTTKTKTIAALVEEARRVVEEAKEAARSMPPLAEEQATLLRLAVRASGLACLLSDCLPVLKAAAEQARVSASFAAFDDGATYEQWAEASLETESTIRAFLAAHPGALDETPPTDKERR